MSSGTMNRFGCTADMFLARFKTGSYNPHVDDFGGLDAVENSLDSAEDQVIQAMPEEVFKQFTQIDLEMVEMRATAGQTVVTTTFKPITPGKTYVWKGQPRYFSYKPYKSTDLLSDQYFFDPSIYRPLSELKEGTDYTLDNTTGIITFAVALLANDQVAVSYWPLTSDILYAIPSLAQCVADGAAYMRAAIVYPRGSSQWEYLNVLNEQFTNKLAALQDKTWIPPEMRLMNYWKEVVPVTDDKTKIKTGQLFRG